MYRRTFKFCKSCGKIDRSDRLKANHFKTCQPCLGKSERGYLLDGQLPETDVEHFQMTLKVIGMNAVKSVPKAADETSSDSEAPDDDVASDKS